MAKKFQLQIPEPCHEDWEKMTPDAQGRFCNSCQKGVVDFSSMCDSQLVAFFKKPTTGSVCGRFVPDQLERDILIPGKRIPWMKYFFQIAIPAFLFSQKARAQGSVRMLTGDTVLVEKRVFKEHILNCEKRPATKNKIQIKGTVIDFDGKGIPYASIIIKGTNTGTSSDSTGNFKMEVIKSKSPITLISSCVGFLPAEAVVNTYSGAQVEINMTTNRVVNGEVVVVGYGSIKGKVRMGAVSSIRRTSIFQKAKEFFVKDSISLFPNPARSNEAIIIKWEKATAGEFRFDLYNQQGQLIKSESSKTESDFLKYSFKLPSVPAGTYFLRMTNKKTSRHYTEKIIVQ